MPERPEAVPAPAGPAKLPVRGLSVVATSACNLACGYCYRRCAAPRSLAWPDLKRTLDWARDPPGGALEVVFTGGEPLLVPGLLRRAVRYLRRPATPGPPVTVRVLSNGTLLDEDLLAFLRDHDVHLNLSCDGVAAAQERRGRGTWRRLDGLLAVAAARHPRWFETRLQVTATVTGANLPYLADSVDYLLGKGVAAIGLSPALTAAPGGDGDPRPLLAAQLARIGAQALRLYESTGRVPLLALRKHRTDPAPHVRRRGRVQGAVRLRPGPAFRRGPLPGLPGCRGLPHLPDLPAVRGAGSGAAPGPGPAVRLHPPGRGVARGLPRPTGSGPAARDRGADPGAGSRGVRPPDGPVAPSRGETAAAPPPP